MIYLGNVILRQENLDSKLGVLDVLAKLNNETYCNIEMQMTTNNSLIERILYYWSCCYAKQIKIGDDYSKLQKTIVILINGENIKNLKHLPYHSNWKIIEEKNRQTILTDKLEIRIIELPKLLKLTEENSELADWLYFLINPNDERVIEKMKTNKELKQANDKLETLSQDEKMQILAELRYRAIVEENTARSEGFEDGHNSGFKQGIEQGIKQNSRKIVKNLLKHGLSISEIKEITELSEDVIKNIHNELDT